MRAQHTLTVVPRLPDQLGPLRDITSDLSNLFDPRVRDLFRSIDSHAVDTLGLDPLAVLVRLSQTRVRELADDASFVARTGSLAEELRRDRDVARWYALRPPSPLKRVAYLSPEFGIAASVPQYSGGLGVLAGDHLKAADDLGVPIVGVGLFYRRGYFQQALDRAGRQTEWFPDLHPETLAFERVQDLTIEVPIGAAVIRAAVWKATVGSVPLYLLDTNVDGHPDTHPDQLMTDRLYGGHTEDRIKQEILLGVGGYRALDALGLLPDVFHLNEGHAGFLVLEAIRRVMHDNALTLDEAVEVVRPSVVFTTHTPVPAGIDRFPRHLIETYLGWWCAEVGITIDDLMSIGGEPNGEPDSFNLAAMSLRLSGSANGVSKLHGAVSREMFAEVWPSTPTEEVPIESVTNGVHAETWTSDAQSAMLRRHVGDLWPLADHDAWRSVRAIPDEELWSVRREGRQRLVKFVRERSRSAAERRGSRDSETRWCDALLDPEILTIGFARRFATYKRATLLLRDADRFRAMLLNKDRPVQFVYAGKAHPADEPGKEFLRQIASFASSPDIRERMVFVENYDIDAGRILTQGVDVWLNTPLRPLEACGTSGMKAAFNGALNCSVLDGWWDEMYRPDLGWAIASDDSTDDPEERDDRESKWLFDLLEHDVIPEFYTRDEQGLPTRWIARVKNSLMELGPRISSTRMMRDYVEQHYEQAASRSETVRADSFVVARELAAWRDRVERAWPKVSVSSVKWPLHDAVVGAPATIEVRADLDGLDDGEVEVQVLSGPVSIDGELSSPDISVLPVVSREGTTTVFSGEFVCTKAGASGLAVRIVPRHRHLRAWTDLRLVRWAVR